MTFKEKYFKKEIRESFLKIFINVTNSQNNLKLTHYHFIIL